MQVGDQRRRPRRRGRRAGAAIRRRWPTRARSTGSVTRRTPSRSITAVECPSQVSRSGRSVRGPTPGPAASRATPRGSHGRPRRSEIGPSGAGRPTGCMMKGRVCGAAHAAVEGDQLLEGAALVELGVVEAVDHDVGDVGEAVGAREVLGGRRREGRERVLALHAPRGEVALAPRAEDDGAVAPRSGRAGSRCGGGRGAPGAGRGGARRSPPGSAARGAPSGRSRPRLPEPRTMTSPPTSSPGSSSPPAPRPVASPTACPTARVVLVAGLHLGDRAARQGAAHQVLERVAVALQEGGALGLAVVREHHDLVGARARTGGPARCGRTAGRACAAPRACRRAPCRSGGPPRRRRRRWRTPPAVRPSCR